MASPVNGSTHLIPALLLIYRPIKDERLSWVTCSGWFTHISGHPSAAGRAQDRESSPVRDRRSTSVLRHQQSLVCSLQNEPKCIKETKAANGTAGAGQACITIYHIRQSEVEYRLAFRNNLHIASIKQFHKESVNWEIQ